MVSYKERILESIRESDMGLTTVDVAKKAGVSKTTVIKYLSVLKSEGRCEYVEVGPAKLWRATPVAKSRTPATEESADDSQCVVESLEVKSVGESDDGKTLSLSFRVKPEQVASLLRQIRNCTGERTS
ncbi:MAG: hypothetical protein A4E45_02325 [Methanosaeta sp. PtaB.Bin039]|nr:MAG: hypothetical protein A4E45_02325 [Methanosaeta sp. PtaB.Bin039]HOT05961.1 FaeA/PapI family transcriptional regulator [Methanotrichaceae archaeon]HQF16835.1 FaeA/PapI family transcriptional regulator [Methanotrichaceae archaeon]HQI90161.1 FaeA/PapI family transcriptional regulator [Methanotrichaceae archaeon]HQJ29117.1 FaeA/PapI family transcriptional regulator [Methanotrichaceae archaeon]